MKLSIKDFEAVIFDMDGVLIDSEPLWKIAMEDVFMSVGCNLTRKDFQKTVGLRIDEVISYWFQHSPWEEFSKDEVERKIVLRMIELITEFTYLELLAIAFVSSLVILWYVSKR